MNCVGISIKPHKSGDKDFLRTLIVIFHSFLEYKETLLWAQTMTVMDSWRDVFSYSVCDIEPQKNSAKAVFVSYNPANKTMSTKQRKLSIFCFRIITTIKSYCFLSTNVFEEVKILNLLSYLSKVL